MKQLFRMLQYGEEIWRGKAYDVEHAEERFFSTWDETPGSLERYTLQRWGKVKLSSSITADGWKTVYADACLA